MQFVKLNDVTLHYQVFGRQEGKPVLVFSNSLGTDFRIWRDVIMRFAGEYAIVAYDKRGHGLSDAPPPPYRIEDHVDDLAALLDHLKIKGALVCGLSVGGVIAQGLALSRPDLVKALVLCDTGHKIGNDALWNERIAAVERFGVKAISAKILERWFSKEFRSDDNPFFAGYRNMLERTPVNGYVGTCHALRDADFTTRLSAIAVPALCVVGSEDGSTPPALVKELAGLIANADYAVIDGAGHLPCIEKPEQLCALMLPFLKSALSS